MRPFPAGAGACRIAADLLLTCGESRSATTGMLLAGWRGPPPVTSRSAAGGSHVLAAATSGRVGVDVELPSRIVANARADDAWLSPAEHGVVAGASDPVPEMACRWVLKEAYGKALGVGLALPLAALTFRGEGGTILIAGTAAPPAEDNWCFTLFRRAQAIIAVAWSDRNAVRTGRQEAATAAARQVQHP